MSNDDTRYEEHILELLVKLKNGTATEQEIAEIDEWYDQPISTERYTDGMSESEKSKAKEKIFKNISARIDAKKTFKIFNINVSKTFSIAAIFLVLITVGLFFWLQATKKDQNGLYTAISPPQRPGPNALLTLSDGRQIALNNVRKGMFTREGSTSISKKDNNQIVYNTGTSPNSKVEYNTMSTLRGGEYRIILADGTKVWLNAASSIRFPASFPGKERVVEVSGEAYFEVAHQALKPFKVITKQQVIEVLGTHFNVNAYENEPQIRTTLLQGSIKIVSNGKKTLLKPGEQALSTPKDLKLSEADVEEAVAWKNGFFEFNDANLESIMRQISRWYDVDIVYEGKIPSETFSGRVSKFLDVRQVLTLIKSPNIHIDYNGRRIMIKE